MKSCRQELWFDVTQGRAMLNLREMDEKGVEEYKI